jgi:hypothetical protein
MLNKETHPWAVLKDGLPTGQSFSNAACAATTAIMLGYRRGSIWHPLHGEIGSYSLLDTISRGRAEEGKQILRWIHPGPPTPCLQ